jgi:hypothetical protein
MYPTKDVPACEQEWGEVGATHPQVIVRRTVAIPWQCVNIIHWMVDPSSPHVAHAISFIRRSCRLGRLGVTCKIYAARLGVGGAGSSQCDFAIVSERVSHTWAQLFRGRRPSAAAEYGLLRGIACLLHRGYWHERLTFNSVGMKARERGLM